MPPLAISPNSMIHSYWPLRFRGSSKGWFKSWRDFLPVQKRKVLDGWGMIVPEKMDPIFLVMLRKLIEHRSKTRHSGRFLDIFTFKPNECVEGFINRTQLMLQLGKQKKSYNLMLLGSEEHIPRKLATRLSQMHAVGRLEMSIPEEYYYYSRDLVKVEMGIIKKGVTFLNQDNEGSKVALQIANNIAESHTKLRVHQLTRCSTKDGNQALTLHLKNSDANPSTKATNPISMLEARDSFNPQGHVVFRINSNKTVNKCEKNLLGSQRGSALAMVHLSPRSAFHGINTCLPKLLDGFSIGSAISPNIYKGELKSGHTPVLPIPHIDYVIWGDPAVSLGHNL